MRSGESATASFARWGVHGLRIGLLLLIVLLLRWQHADYLAKQSRNSQTLLPLETVRRFYKAAASTVASETVQGGQAAFNAQQELLGTLLQTSPIADDILGFSGPTNVLIVCDAESRVIDLEILSSRDTREHVRQVKEHPRFLRSFHGRTLVEITAQPRVDAVSGATLTSYAIAESVLKRLGSQRGSLKFAEPPTLADARLLFPQAAAIEIDAADSALIRVRNEAAQPLGWLLRTSPAADNTIGYQGPTAALIGFSTENRVIGVAIYKSYDNEPYVGYVREDTYFREFFNEKTLPELAGLDLKKEGVEGVSGATMTSLGVAQGILLAAKKKLAESLSVEKKSARFSISWSDFGSTLVIVCGVIVSVTNLRGQPRLRFAWQWLVIVYLGFINGTLLSQALLVGWAQTGVPLNAVGLIVLSVAALVLPIATKRNVYCSHLCPHGALQQLTLKYARPQRHLPHQWKVWLAMLPAALLAWCLFVGMMHAGFSLVDIEPFDAYLFRIAGWATLAIAGVGLAASCFTPMAYCRYGCPTGALLEFLRSNARSERWTRRDWFAVGCVLFAVTLHLCQRLGSL